MRKIAVQKLGYYPLPPKEAERIGRFLVFSGQASSVLDPCAGTGAVLATITAGANVIPYAIELDAYRAEEAAKSIEHVIQGNCFDVHCPVDSFSCLYLNPPYDFECSEGRNERMERLFLSHCYRWLRPGGVLVMVIPAERVAACSEVLSAHFREIDIYRLTEADSARYRQVAVLGIRRSRQERERLKDVEVSRARARLYDVARKLQDLPPLPDEPDRTYAVPPASRPVELVYRGLFLDAIEDMLQLSAAYRQAGRILFAPPTSIAGRPLTPLHPGHVGILAVSGNLDGLFGRGEDRHLACWSTGKATDRFEDTDDHGVTTIRERERFTQTLTLLYTDGRAAILTEGKADEKRSSSNGAPGIPEGDQGHDDAHPASDGSVDC